jgi:hypothetical protein
MADMADNCSAEKDENRDTNKDSRFLFEQYKVLSERRINHNSLLWQTPVMFFTAQAFLMMISLGNNNYPWWSRAIAAFVSFVFSIFMDILFENNRAMEITDAEQMLDIETYLIRCCKVTGQIIHSKQDERCYLDQSPVRERQFQNGNFTKINRIPSYNLWTYCFRFIAGVSALVFLYTMANQFHDISEFIHTIDESLKALILLILAFDTILLFVAKAYRVRGTRQTQKKISALGYGIYGIQNMFLILFCIYCSQSSNVMKILVVILSNVVGYINLVQTFMNRRKAKNAAAGRSALL